MNIVVVEDSELVRNEILRRIAQHPRLNVVGTATEEEEAVNLILATSPDAVLLDLSLAPGSGIRVLERARAADCGARVLVLSNFAEPALHDACAALGALGFYDKTSEFDACLKRLLDWLPALPDDEAHRLDVLHATHLLDTQEQEALDNLTHLAAEIADTPLALISLVDENRQWFLAHHGTDVRETSRSISFCAHAILRNELMEIPDALADPRFADNPLVVGPPHIRFYAGMPLVLASGETLGTLCVADRQPKRLSARQQRALKTLATSVVAEIELRRRILYLEQEAERRRAAEAHVLHLATRDPLTALPNRATFCDRLSQHIRLASRRNATLAVLFIDLDRFKPINDTLGHDVGDDALVAVADRLNRSLRNSDTVARLGGDEFAVVLPDIANHAEAMMVAGKINAALREPFSSKGRPLHLDASIGVAIFPEHGQIGDQLLRHADLAMYQAKQSGGGRASLYARALSDRAEEMQVLDGELRDAVRRNELVLHYQPQVVLATGRLCGVEALVRWRHPHYGMLPPSHFIPLAEQRGFIHELTSHILNLALVQLREWEAAGLHVPRVAVNVSPSEIRGGFAETVEAALFRHGIEPHRLEIEITESTLTSDGLETMQLLDHLREMGVGISVDDFGVGYSSLSQLHRLPIDCLKIDRSFVADIETSTADVAIVRAIVTMADAMGLRTVAEGVENDSQLQLLEKLGCACIQGYLISRPVPGEEAAAWMSAFVAAGEEQ